MSQLDIKKELLRRRKDVLFQLSIVDTLTEVYEWFLLKNKYNFNHTDIRGNYGTIILATTDNVVVDRDEIKKDFEEMPFYDMAKKLLITVGTAKASNKTYFYIQVNHDLNRMFNKEEMKQILLNRTNSELFDHIDNYLK